MATSNPFAHLVKSKSATEEPPPNQEKDVLEDEAIPVHLPEKGDQRREIENESELSKDSRIIQSIDKIIQRVFLITVDSGKSNTASLRLATLSINLVNQQGIEKQCNDFS